MIPHAHGLVDLASPQSGGLSLFNLYAALPHILGERISGASGCRTRGRRRKTEKAQSVDDGVDKDEKYRRQWRETFSQHVMKDKC